VAVGEAGTLNARLFCRNAMSFSSVTLKTREQISLANLPKPPTTLLLSVSISVICLAAAAAAAAAGCRCIAAHDARELLLTCRANAVRHFSRTTLIRPACLPSGRGRVPAQDDSKFDLLI